METGNPRSLDDSNFADGMESGRESVVAVATEIVKELEQTSKTGGRKSWLQSYWDVVAERGPRLKKSVECTAADTFQWVNSGSRGRAILIISTGAIAFTGLVGLSFFFLFLTAAVLCSVLAALLGSMAVVGTVAAIFFSVVTGTYMVALATAGLVTGIAVFCTVVTALFVSGWIAFWWIVWMAFAKALRVAHGVLYFAVSRVSNVSDNSFRRTREIEDFAVSRVGNVSDNSFRRTRESTPSGIQKRSE